MSYSEQGHELILCPFLFTVENHCKLIVNILWEVNDTH